MEWTPTEVDGCWIIDITPFSDDRGFFTRIVDETEFADHGLPTHFPQANMSHNHKAGTMRGMHRQIAPSSEGKLVRCMKSSTDNRDENRARRPVGRTWLGPAR